jgi:hypothetical protein
MCWQAAAYCFATRCQPAAEEAIQPPSYRRYLMFLKGIRVNIFCGVEFVSECVL